MKKTKDFYCTTLSGMYIGLKTLIIYSKNKINFIRDFSSRFEKSRDSSKNPDGTRSRSVRDGYPTRSRTATSRSRFGTRSRSCLEIDNPTCSQQITRTEATKLHYCLMSQQGPPRDAEGQSPCLLDFHPLGPRTVGHQSDFVWTYLRPESSYGLILLAQDLWKSVARRAPPGVEES